MPSFEQGDVVKVPFPYTDRATRQYRPAAVISTGRFAATYGLLWVTMITSAENRGWEGDVEIGDLVRAGLPAPSVIRTAKVATIEARDAAILGNLSPETQRRVLKNVGQVLAQRTGH